VLKRLQLAALGLSPVPDWDWQELEPPAGLWLPLLAWRLGEQAPPRLKGLLRYTWARYQSRVFEVRQIVSICRGPCLVIDDLALATCYYPSPSSRSLEGIDLLPSEEDRHKLENWLLEQGWTRPPWPVPPHYSELRSATQERLRLHRCWLPWGPDRAWEAGVWERAVERQNLLFPAPEDLWWRLGCMSDSRLWLTDMMCLCQQLPDLGRSVPPQLEPALWRWNQIARRQLGRDLVNPEFPKGSWSLADWVLALHHRRSPRWARLWEQLSWKLKARGQWGFPLEWIRACRDHWNLDSPWQLPMEALRRGRKLL